MPCFSKILTLLIDLKTIEEAAKALGISVTKRTPNSYTLRRGSEYINIERVKEGEKFSVSPYSSSNGFQEQILKPLLIGYARERMKQFAQKRGYTVSTGSKPNSYVLTKYS